MIKGLPGDYFAASLSGKMHLYFKYFILTGWWAEEGVTIQAKRESIKLLASVKYKSHCRIISFLSNQEFVYVPHEKLSICKWKSKTVLSKNASYKSTRFHSSTVYTVKQGFSPYCHTEKFPLQVKDFFLLAFNNWHKFPLQMKGYFFTTFTQTKCSIVPCHPRRMDFSYILFI